MAEWRGETVDGPEPGEELADDECYECGGEHVVVADCFEDSCCCAEPEIEHGVVACPVCS